MWTCPLICYENRQPPKAEEFSWFPLLSALGQTRVHFSGGGPNPAPPRLKKEASVA